MDYLSEVWILNILQGSVLPSGRTSRSIRQGPWAAVKQKWPFGWRDMWRKPFAAGALSTLLWMVGQTRNIAKFVYCMQICVLRILFPPQVLCVTATNGLVNRPLVVHFKRLECRVTGENIFEVMKVCLQLKVRWVFIFAICRKFWNT